jgi:murein DD-endopeptidase MepM/ murein hydrolase activator NlpD
MGRAGDDRLGDPFDPGLETGYLRRAPRDRPLEPELGAHPFDPGPERYDDRRARRATKQRQRQERRRRERAERLRRERGAGGSGAAPADPSPDPAPEQAADVVPFPRRRPSIAERLERERAERERVEHERRARVERQRAERERAERERREVRRRERAERLRHDREALRRQRSRPAARVQPSVQGPVRKRARAAENRRRAAARRHGLFWPTAKAGLAVTVVLGLSAALGSLLGLPVPGPSAGAGHAELGSSADLFGIDPGTPVGLSAGFVFPLMGPHDFGEADARFGAERYGHIHEGQDIFAKPGTPEVAVHDGVVVDWGTENGRWSGGRGNYLAIYSQEDNRSFVYMHMLKPSPVHLGQQVHAGEVIGQLGCSGSCDGPHLHFEVRIGKATLRSDTKPVDPLPYLRQWPQPTPG